jgi:RimJ/RimL family protein N-acetyltransferase
MVLDPSVRGQGWPLEGMALFLRYLLDVFGFRRFYFETFEFSAPAFAYGHRSPLTEECRLKEYEWFDGRYWDKLIYVLDREAAGGFLERVLGSA